MTTQELMRIRYKVIAPYPYIPFEVLQILTVDFDGELHSELHGYVPSKTCVMESEAYLYPHIFRKMEWWEERKPEEMPLYLKFIRNYYSAQKGDIEKVIKYQGRICFIGSATYLLDEKDILPATKQEYLDQP